MVFAVLSLLMVLFGHNNTTASTGFPPIRKIPSFKSSFVPALTNAAFHYNDWKKSVTPQLTPTFKTAQKSLTLPKLDAAQTTLAAPSVSSTLSIPMAPQHAVHPTSMLEDLNRPFYTLESHVQQSTSIQADLRRLLMPDTPKDSNIHTLNQK